VSRSAPRWRHLPWFDGIAGLVAGCLELALRDPLADLYGVTRGFVTTIAIVNLGYSMFGLTLGPMRRRPAWLLATLIAANLAWAAICVVLAARASGVTMFAHAHLLGEGAFVAALAGLEWRYRRAILGLDAR
jgi:hypothetical protein